jgi:hypothetical protein
VQRFGRQANAAVEQVTRRRAIGEVIPELTPKTADEVT